MAPLAVVLATAGVLVSVTVTSALVHLVLDVDVRTAIVLGAVASSTDAAAVLSVLRTVPVRGRLRSVLEAESGFNDPPVIILVTVVTSDAWGSGGALVIAGQVGYQLVGGVVLGLAVARGGVLLLARSALPASGLAPLATLAIAFGAFAVAGLVGASGLMAIYVAGLVLGNARLPHRSTTDSFVEGLAWLAQIGLFVLLGLLASPDRLLEALPTALVVGVALTLVARPVSVAVCATPFRVPWRDQAFVSWAGLRGAVPIVLATIPMSVGLPGAERIFDVVFLLVVLFTLLQGPTLPAVARWTGAALDAATRDVVLDSAPLDDIDAVLLRFDVPAGRGGGPGAAAAAGCRADAAAARRLPLGADARDGAEGRRPRARGRSAVRPRRGGAAAPGGRSWRSPRALARRRHATSGRGRRRRFPPNLRRRNPP